MTDDRAVSATTISDHSEDRPATDDHSDDRPATDAWLVLEDGEQIVWAAHPRSWRAVPAVVASFLLAVGLLGVAVVLESIVVVLALVPAAIPAAYAYLRVVTTHYVLTDRALYRKHGIAGTTVRTVGLDRVQNTRSRQGLLGTRFDYGTVEVDIAGGRDLRFDDVYSPTDVRALVDRLSGSIAPAVGRAEQWRAVRDELRAIRVLLEERSTASES